MRIFLITLLVCLSVCKVYAQSTDSVSTHHLQELVVKTERMWIDNEKINVIPTKSEKKLSNSAASLIRSMNLTFLQEKDDNIINHLGENVTIFINGEKANNVDLSTFWPKEVKMVQYIENSKDPAYEGYKNVVNFIMPDYKVGGVSKLNLFQKVPNNGFFTLSSKAVYKKMTYGFMLNGGYRNDHRSEIEEELQYKDIYYNGEKYDIITRCRQSRGYDKDNYLRAAFNAKYASNKMRLTHTFSFGWEITPGNGLYSIDSWSDNLFNSTSSYEFSKSNQITPQITGDYAFKLADKWYIYTFWQYAYAKNKNYSSNQIGENTPVCNKTFEDVHSVKLSLSPNFIPSEKLYFQLATNVNLDWFGSYYSGSANLKQNQRRQYLSGEFTARWSPVKSLNISLNPGVYVSLWQIGSIRQHTVKPTISSNIYWTVSKKWRLGGNLSLFMRAPSPSESNPVLIKNSDLLWSEGNPYLKTLTNYVAGISTSYLPNNWFSLSASVRYDKVFNDLATIYTPASIEQGGLIKKIINVSPTDRYTAVMSLRGSLFKSTLSIKLTPAWTYYYYRSPYRTHLGRVSVEGDVNYTLGNFMFTVRYEPSYRSLGEGGMVERRGQGQLNANVTYGTGNLFIRIGAEDILNNKNNSWSRFISQNYSSNQDFLRNGRRFFVNLTYTIGYGKKVDRRIDINGPSTTETSVR